MYNLIPRASCLSDIGRRGLSIIGHLNINSICNKFEMLSMSVAQYVDMLILSETKLESTLKKKTLWPLFMDRVQLPQGYNHF